MFVDYENVTFLALDSYSTVKNQEKMCAMFRFCCLLEMFLAYFEDAVLLINGLSIDLIVYLLPQQNVLVGHLYWIFLQLVYGFDSCNGDTCQTCA
jgi:hypothetical protein